MNLAAREEAIMVNRTNGGVAVVHIRFEGRSLEIPQGDLDIGPASSDHEIKRVLAQHLNVAEAQLRDYVIDRHETGNLTVRPESLPWLARAVSSWNLQRPPVSFSGLVQLQVTDRQPLLGQIEVF